MGGILLICVLISIYLVVYWSVDIEIADGKTKGFFKFIPTASETLSDNKRPQRKVFTTKASVKTKQNLNHAEKMSIAMPSRSKKTNIHKLLDEALPKNAPVKSKLPVTNSTLRKPQNFNHHTRQKK